MIRKSLLSLFVLSVFTLLSEAQPVTFSWAESIGGRATLLGKLGMARDANGDYYITGQFTGTRSFGSYSQTASGTNDVFVAKISSAGTVLWAVKGGHSFSNASPGGIAIQGSNVYVIGGFSNFISFGATCTTSAGGMGNNVFVTSLNAADGTCNWIFKGDGNGSLNGVAIAPATGGGVYIYGTMVGQIMLGTTTLNGSPLSDTDVFYGKIDATGTCVWAKKFGGMGGNETAGGITEINGSAIAINGGFEDVISYAGGSITSSGGTDFFIAKTTLTGDVSWAKSGGGDNTDAGSAISADTAGNIYSAGIIGDTVIFGPIWFPNPQNINAMIVKYNASGVVQWIRMGGTNVDDNAEALVTDANGSSYITGYVSGNAVFSGTPLSGVQGNDSYVVKYNTFGQVVWITRVGSAGGEFGKAITYDGAGVCATAGEFEGTLSLPGVAPVSSPGGGIYGVYVTKLGGGSIGIDEVNEIPVSVYPNPAANEIFLNTELIPDEVFTVDLVDMQGKVVINKLQSKTSSCTIDVRTLPIGKYFVKVSSSLGEHSVPVLVVRP